MGVAESPRGTMRSGAFSMLAAALIVACGPSTATSRDVDPTEEAPPSRPPSGKGPSTDAATPVADCDDECAKDGAKECSPGGVATYRVCETAPNGCRVWKVIA